MSSRVHTLAVAVLCLLPACSKHTPNNEAPSESAPAPRRNAAEALGFASEASEGYFQSGARSEPNPAANSAPNGGALSKSAGVATRPVRRTLTAKDGRRVEAELLGRSETMVKFRRVSDALEFTFPLSELSDSDQRFIREASLPGL